MLKIKLKDFSVIANVKSKLRSYVHKHEKVTLSVVDFVYSYSYLFACI